MSLDAASLGTPVRVVRVHSGGVVSHRLMELGLIEGAVVQILRRAPLGDPLQVRVGDYELALRSSEARLIDVSAI